MKRKLLLVNALLAGAAVLMGAELYRAWLEGEARLHGLEAPVRELAAPEYPPPGAAPRTRPSDFMPVVERLLFSKDRNPVVEVIVAEVEPERRPDLPLLAGLVDFGGGPRALMAAAADGRPEWVSVGGKVGAFVFEGLEGDKVKLSWKGEPFEVAQEQLAGVLQPRAAEESAARRPARGGAAPAAPAGQPAANMATPAAAAVGGDHNIGRELRPGVFSADPKDPAPDGTAYKDYVKRVRATPFGSQSWWEKKK
jgi:hypothetical protein